MAMERPVATASHELGSGDREVGAGTMTLGMSARSIHPPGDIEAVARSLQDYEGQPEVSTEASDRPNAGGSAEVASPGLIEARELRASNATTLSNGLVVPRFSNTQNNQEMDVTPALSDAALTGVPRGEPSSQPITTGLDGKPAPSRPEEGSAESDGRLARTFKGIDGDGRISHSCPRPRMSRLSSFKSRLSPSTRASSVPDDEGRSDSPIRRPRFSRRLSRSLTSLQASLLANGEPCDGALDPEGGQDDGKKFAKWKAKLAAALKGPTADSPPTSPLASYAAFLPAHSRGLGRAASRSRSHSAPLFLPRGPVDRCEADLLPALATPAPLPVRAGDKRSGAAPVFLRPSTPLSPCASPDLCEFTTCPSSPFTEPQPALLGPDPGNALVSPTSPPAYFASLPRELQLAVFAAVLQTCEEDWLRNIREGKWVGRQANARWSDGRAHGRRELVKLGRVCREWRALSLDGQLWATAPASDLIGGEAYTPEGVASLLQGAGMFVTTLDARGMGGTLTSSALEPLLSAPYTRLRKIDLTGCNAITSFTLSRLITHSPDLADLAVPGLRCVAGEHMRALAMHCPRLARLDISRCPDLTAHWLFALPYPPPRNELSSTSDSEQRGLRRLKAAGLAGVDLVDIGLLLHWHPHLATLDVSFAVGLEDTVLERLIARPPQPVRVGPSQVEARHDGPRFSLDAAPVCKRTYPDLRHLNLSGCKRISGAGLDHLAHALPNLEILELSGIGSGLRAHGLARLLGSCTKLRKLDLEDASETTDEALLALVPSRFTTTSDRGGVVVTGAPNLTHLIIANCRSFTDEAIAAVALERGCTRLRVLEADGTAISDRTAKAFVRLAGARALAAQSAACCAREGMADQDPLVASKLPAVLSVLDNRTTGRRLSRDSGWGTTLRTRNGQRGYWTRAVGWYHDYEAEERDSATQGQTERNKAAKRALDECDPTRVVVRSFYSHLAVDAAYAAREATDGESRTGRRSGGPEGAGGGGGQAREALLRSRALSESHIFRSTRATDDDEGRVGCVIS